MTDAQYEIQNIDKEIAAFEKTKANLPPDSKRLEAVNSRIEAAKRRRQNAENLMRPQRIPRLQAAAKIDSSLPSGQLLAPQRINQGYINQHLIAPLRELKDAFSRTKQGKYESRAVGRIDSMIRGLESSGNPGVSAQDTVDFFNGIVERIGKNTPTGRNIAHAAENIAKILQYPDMQEAMRNVQLVNQKIRADSNTGKAGREFYRASNEGQAAFQEELIGDDIERIRRADEGARYMEGLRRMSEEDSSGSSASSENAD